MISTSPISTLSNFVSHFTFVFGSSNVTVKARVTYLLYIFRLADETILMQVVLDIDQSVFHLQSIKTGSRANNFFSTKLEWPRMKSTVNTIILKFYVPFVYFSFSCFLNFKIHFFSRDKGLRFLVLQPHFRVWNSPNKYTLHALNSTTRNTVHT